MGQDLHFAPHQYTSESKTETRRDNRQKKVVGEPLTVPKKKALLRSHYLQWVVPIFQWDWFPAVSRSAHASMIFLEFKASFDTLRTFKSFKCVRVVTITFPSGVSNLENIQW